MENLAEHIYITTVSMVTANQEYHLELRKVKGFRIQCRDGSAFRFAFEKDKVGSATPSEPYHTVLANGHVIVKNLNIDELHLYLAESTGAKVAEVIAWE